MEEEKMTKVRKVCGVLLAIFIPIYIFAFIVAHHMYGPETVAVLLKLQFVIFSITFCVTWGFSGLWWC